MTTLAWVIVVAVGLLDAFIVGWIVVELIRAPRAVEPRDWPSWPERLP